ncbi:juvenile hormone epoxide hydrolase 1-like [Cylas formicarius]|uniref:juvenile hormone epoxide hydrolase 1-like n=1 Tax=Cylas formicarius TaxID=197179 RepID=UPI0029588340|nr:juvenile hormone epoxide hydrolase 1-like [Cylas formicarius]
MMPIMFYVVLLVIILVFYVWKKHFKTQNAPDIEELWWRPREDDHDETIKPFKIDIPREIIADLNQRLSSVLPFEPPLTDDHSFGVNTKFLNEVVDYWKTKYDWSERQKFLNQYPQFQTRIQGLNVHFLHIKPENPPDLATVPLLLLHGWPGSIREFYEIIPYLTKPQPGRGFVFELVIPSLPGYGFSEAPSKPGLESTQMAAIFKNLMIRLDHPKFFVQGGDWGAIIAQDLATLYPEHLLGLHSNMPVSRAPIGVLKIFLGSIHPSLVGITERERKKIYPMSKVKQLMYQETGYSHLHFTKPDTIGVALRDSPVGLAAYILEKFITWTDIRWQKRNDHAEFLQRFDLDHLLDNIMIYWVTRTITTSMRLYAFRFQSQVNLDRVPVIVPTGFAKFFNELFFFPKAALEDKFINVVHFREYDVGGHFPAFEVPDVLARDIFDFVEVVRSL